MTDLHALYRRVYRKLHPRHDPYSAYERQHELDDLWEADQQKFIETVNVIHKDQTHDQP